MAELAKVRRNVATMIDKGATEEEIDAYLASEKTSAEVLRRNKSFFAESKPPRTMLDKIALGSRAVGLGAASPVLMVADAPAQIYNAGAGLFNMFGGKASRFPTVSETTNKYVTAAGAPTPETTAEKLIYAGAHGAAGAAAFPQASGPVANSLWPTFRQYLSGLTGGVGGQAGHEVGGPVGGMLGSVAGALSPNVGSVLRGPAASRIATATQGMTEADWRAGITRQNQAKAGGISVTGPEALNVNDLLAKQLLVEQHPKSAPIMQSFLSRRPDQVSDAIQGVLSDMGPKTLDPAMTGANISKAAQKSIDAARQSGNAKAAPFYQKAEPQRIPSSDWNTLTANPVVLNALEKVKKDPYYAVSAMEPEGSIRWLDAAKKYLDDQAGSFSDKGKNYASSIAGGTAKDIRATADLTSRDYATARSIVEKNLQQAVEPRELGTIGALSRTTDPSAQFARLINPELSNTETVLRAAKDLKMTDPKAFQELVRKGLDNEFDRAFKALQGDKNQEFAGARFARQLRETPRTKANIDALIGSLPDGPIRLKALDNLLDQLALTGNRFPVGSRTAFNQRQLSDMSSGNLVSSVVQNPTRLGGNWIGQTMENFTARSFARIFTDPNSAQLMRNLAITKPGTARMNTLIGTVLGAQPKQESDDGVNGKD